MSIITATETKNKFGKVLLQVAKEPITIEKSGSPVAVIMSYEEYEHYQVLEDCFWGERAVSSRAQGGYISGADLLNKIQKHID